jgi:glycosyltransferase involved in cell wall biosynthesis
MKVLMTTDAVGGVWAYATELRAALTREGVEVVLACLGPEPPPEAGVPHHPGRLEWQDDPWADVVAAAEWLLELAGSTGADVMHANSYSLGSLPWRRPVVVVGHSCVLSWFDAVRGHPAPPAWDPYRVRVAHGLLCADEVVAPTAAMLGDLRRLYGLGDRGRVIHNGVSAHPGGRVEKEPFVLAAGRLWDEAKGLDVLEAAASPWPVEVAGPGGGGGAGRVRLLGPLPRDALRERMGRAAIFAHPARYEPFGLAVLEAALAGCTLVLGDIPTLRELWDGVARFVAPGDAAALGEALEEAAEHPVSAVERAREYGAARMGREYAALYARLAQAVPA